jgi:hypothetical protein
MTLRAEEVGGETAAFPTPRVGNQKGDRWSINKANHSPRSIRTSARACVSADLVFDA